MKTLNQSQFDRHRPNYQHDVLKDNSILSGARVNSSDQVFSWTVSSIDWDISQRTRAILASSLSEGPVDTWCFI